MRRRLGKSETKQLVEATKAEKVISLDVHPTEPWILIALHSGTVCIWNFQSQTSSWWFVTQLPVRSAKFIPRKQWFVTGADDMFIRVYNYITTEKVKEFIAHSGRIRCVAVDPFFPFVLSSSDDMLIKLWNWDSDWKFTSEYVGHLHHVMHLSFHPEHTNLFASASRDRTVKLWDIFSNKAKLTVNVDQEGLKCVHYFPVRDKPYLITCDEYDHTAKVWNYASNSCVHTLEGHSDSVSAVCFHPELPIIITGSEDGTVRIWNSKTFRLENENIFNAGHGRVGDIAYVKGSPHIVLGYDEGAILVEIGPMPEDLHYKFERAIKLGRLKIAHDIAMELESDAKMEQLGNVALATRKFDMARNCIKQATVLRRATDLGGLRAVLMDSNYTPKPERSLKIVAVWDLNQADDDQNGKGD